MASYRRAAWYLCWWGCLFGVLQVVHGAERINVPQPSIQDLLNRASPVLNENPLGYVQAHDSSFQYQQRSYSAPIQQKISIPTPAIKDAVKGALKQQAAVAVASAVVSAAVAAAGWVIDEAGQPVKKVPAQTLTGKPKSSTESYWFNSSVTDYDPEPVCRAILPTSGWGAYERVQIDVANNKAQCFALTKDNKTSSTPYGNIFYHKGNCPGSYTLANGRCSIDGTSPLSESDYESLTSVISSQDSPAKAAIANAACKASLSPSRCYQALQDAASFLNSGPSLIQGPSTTSSTTSKNADGTSTTSTTTKDTKFGMEYDGTGATAKPTTTTTIKDSKGNESTTVDKEGEDSSTGAAPKEDEKEVPSPCATNCDGPAYKDLYTKTDVTKEGVLDTYAAKVKALPIMSAVGNFFTVNGGGSCPVWSGTIDMGWGQSVTLSNDFACQPWFTALSPAFHAVLMLVAAWLAFRVSILD